MEKNIVFINPPVSMKKRYGLFSEAGSKSPPLGLAHLAAVSEKLGWKTTIIDAPTLDMSPPETLRATLDARPAVVGLTAATLSVSDAAAVAVEIKKASPGTVVALGGAHISALPEQTMSACGALDAGAIGEGEDTLADLLGAVESGAGFAGVNGIVYRDGGSLRTTPARKAVENLDSLPQPAWHLLPELAKHYRLSLQAYKREPSFPVISSRGCPFNCAFCDNRVFGRKFRGYSPEYVMEMLETLRGAHGIRDVFFYDDTFMTDLKRVRRICELMIERGTGLVWGCLSRVDTLDADLLKLMRRAGCWQISFGIESGDPEVLKRLNKNITPEKAAAAIRTASRAGFRCHGFFMIGNPGETDSTIDKTARLSRSLPLHTIQVSHFTPFPGSALFEQCAEFGEFNRDFDLMSMWNPVFVPHGFTAEKLRRAALVMLLRFYFRPRIIAGFALMCMSPSGLAKLALLARMFFKGLAKLGARGGGDKR